MRSLFVVVRRRPPIMETLQWDNFCNFGATLLGFGTLFTDETAIEDEEGLKSVDRPVQP